MAIAKPVVNNDRSQFDFKDDIVYLTRRRSAA